MFDSYTRNINYLRVSVTDKCDLRCRYCMPENGIEDIGHTGILTLEEIARFIRIVARAGISKIRLTGGEPLVRKNIAGLIAQIAQIPQINDIAVTTNGMLFADMANELKAAGLSRVNFSLDSLDTDTFQYITRRGDIGKVMRSIDKALELGLSPVKINVVVMKGINDHEILDFVRLAYKMPVHVRFIEFMPVGDLPFYQTDRVVKISEIKEKIGEKYELYSGLAVSGNGPAKSYQIRDGLGAIGFISPMSEHFCSECNRIRLTADGKLRGCLFDKQEISLKLALKNTSNTATATATSDEKILALFTKAVKGKPLRHYMNDGWGENNNRKMYQIGG